MTSETVEECSQILRDWIEREAQMVSSLVFSRPLAATPGFLQRDKGTPSTTRTRGTTFAQPPFFRTQAECRCGTK